MFRAEKIGEKYPRDDMAELKAGLSICKHACKALELWSSQGTLVICVTYGGAYFKPGLHYIFVLGKCIRVALALSSLFRKLEME